MKKLAVLIDGDNISARDAHALFAEIARYGVAHVKRVYGDWSNHQLQSWEDILLKHALTPVQQFAYTKGKNATDMSMVIEAMDLLYSGTFDGFCLVSSDSDFTPLAARIRASGLVVYGFGRRKTPEALRQACDRFIYLENLDADPANDVVAPSDVASAQSTQVGSGASVEGRGVASRQPLDGALRSTLYKAIKENADDAGWASVGQLGYYLSKVNADFDPRSYGYAKLSSMLKTLDGLQFRYDEKQRMYCRKIPYRELIQVVKDGFEQYADQPDSASLSALRPYLEAHLNYRDYGFNRLEDFLQSIHYAHVEGGRFFWQQQN